MVEKQAQACTHCSYMCRYTYRQTCTPTPYLKLSDALFLLELRRPSMRLSLHKTEDTTRLSYMHARTHTWKHTCSTCTPVLTHQTKEGTADSASVTSTGSPTVTVDPIGAAGGDGCGLPESALRGRVP